MQHEWTPEACDAVMQQPGLKGPESHTGLRAPC